MYEELTGDSDSAADPGSSLLHFLQGDQLKCFGVCLGLVLPPPPPPSPAKGSFYRKRKNPRLKFLCLSEFNREFRGASVRLPLLLLWVCQTRTSNLHLPPPGAGAGGLAGGPRALLRHAGRCLRRCTADSPTDLLAAGTPKLELSEPRVSAARRESIHPSGLDLFFYIGGRRSI